MSFGKLNILQHKSWHVGNRDNIERVLRDERELAEKEEQHRKSKSIVESERRTEALRKLKDGAAIEGAKGNGELEGVDPAKQSAALVAASDIPPKYKGYDLFEGIVPAVPSAVDNETSTASGKNTEHEKEKRDEKEREERKCGLVGLGQDSFTGVSAAQKPWYANCDCIALRV